MTPLDKIWASIELGEARLVTSVKNQGKCNSCYAHSAVVSMENAVLLNKIESNTWTPDSSKLDISELFVMMNTYNTKYVDDYCVGGDFVPTMN